jgi:hypothetical protein
VVSLAASETIIITRSPTAIVNNHAAVKRDFIEAGA